MSADPQVDSKCEAHSDEIKRALIKLRSDCEDFGSDTAPLSVLPKKNHEQVVADSVYKPRGTSQKTGTTSATTIDDS